MTFSIYYQINHLFETEPTESWKSKLKDLGLLKFIEVYDIADTTTEQANKIITYLTYCYTIESPHVIKGMDWLENKKAICDKIGLLAVIEPDLLNLQNKVYKDIMLYLLSTLRNRLWYLLCVKKELVQYFFSVALEPSKSEDVEKILKSSELRMTCQQNAAILLKEIKELEDSLQLEEANITGAKYDFKVVKGTSFEEEILS